MNAPRERLIRIAFPSVAIIYQRSTDVVLIHRFHRLPQIFKRQAASAAWNLEPGTWKGTGAWDQ